MSFTYIVDVKVSGGYGIMKKDYKVAVAGTGYVGLSIAAPTNVYLKLSVAI